VKSTTPVSKIKTEFSLQNATNFGGVKIFLEYLEKSQARQGVSEAILHEGKQLAVPGFIIMDYEN